MMVSDGDKARVYVADNVGANATAEQFICTWADLWGEWGAQVLLGSEESLKGG
jgi:hypothetical protein